MAKNLGKIGEYPEWNEVRVTVMKEVLSLKWDHCSSFSSTLLATGENRLEHNVLSRGVNFCGVVDCFGY